MNKKNNFVENNSHLVYSPNAKATFDGGSDGGNGFPVIEYSSNALQIKANDLLEMVDATPAIFKYTYDGETTWAFIIKGSISSNTYYFTALVGTSIVRFAAVSANGKPTKTG